MAGMSPGATARMSSLVSISGIATCMSIPDDQASCITHVACSAISKEAYGINAKHKDRFDARIEPRPARLLLGGCRVRQLLGRRRAAQRNAARHQPPAAPARAAARRAADRAGR